LNDANDVSAKALFEEGLILHKNGSLSQASAIFEQVLKLQPEYVEALHLLGVIASQSNNQLLALDLIEKAISINSSYSVLFNNRGNILYTLNRLEEALVSYEKAINLKKDYADAYYNRGNALKDLKRFDQALVSYDQAINLRTDHPEAYNNRGIVLNYLNNFEEALASYNKAIYLQEDYADAYFNRGNMLYKLKRFDIALASYDQVINLNGKFVLEAHFRRGGLLWELGRLDESLKSYSYVIQSKIEFDFLHGAWFYVKRFICDWLHEKNQIAKLVQEITYNEKTSHPFTILFLMDSLTIQLKSAEIWINANYPENHELLPLTKRPRDKKIRIGYYSSDFYNHATTYLMAELFELHDKNKFELIAFSFGIEQKDEMRKRVSAAFDQFIDIRDKSDKEVAFLSRSIGIDIAIDLKGFTRDARTGIFSYRAAPIQVNYMGYPATMGASYIDYIVADKTLIPNASQQFYSEKVVYLPNSYQVNDCRRPIAGRKIPREKLGLPTTGFVFYKQPDRESKTHLLAYSCTMYLYKPTAGFQCQTFFLSVQQAKPRDYTNSNQDCFWQCPVRFAHRSGNLLKSGLSEMEELGQEWNTKPLFPCKVHLLPVLSSRKYFRLVQYIIRKYSMSVSICVLFRTRGKSICLTLLSQ